MRALAVLAVLAAAGLAACAGDVDGAPCTAPGATVDCPGGQACGNDRRCSARALACAGTRCTPGEDACVDPAGVASGTSQVRRCEDRDPVCGTWVTEDCAAGGYTCGGRSGRSRCECPATATRDLRVLPDGAAVDAPPFATGAATPRACAFRRITDATARAESLATADPSTPVTITVAGVPAGSRRIFSAQTGEASQFTVRSGVALRSDATDGGGTYELEKDDEKPSLVLMYGGSSLEGFTMRNVGRDSGSTAVRLFCGPGARADAVRVSAVTIEARGPAGTPLDPAIHVLGCPAVLTDVHVRDARHGLLLDPLATTTAVVEVHGGSITGSSAAGILMSLGRVRVEGARISGNAGVGVDVSSGGSLELRGSRIVGNGDTGVVVSSPGELRLVGNTIWGNGATTEWGGAPVTSGAARRAGGVVLAGAPPASGLLEVARNRIYGNRGDQLLVLGSASATWNLDQPATCSDAQGPVTNMFGCYDPTPVGTASYRGIVALDASVSALNQWWGPAGPSAADVARLPDGAIPAATTCTWAAPALDCASEDPPPP